MFPLPDVSARSANVGPKLRLAGRKSPSAGSPSNTNPPEDDPSGNVASDDTSAVLNWLTSEITGSFAAGRKCAVWFTPTVVGANVTPLVSRLGSNSDNGVELDCAAAGRAANPASRSTTDTRTTVGFMQSPRYGRSVDGQASHLTQARARSARAPPCTSLGVLPSEHVQRR